MLDRVCVVFLWSCPPRSVSTNVCMLFLLTFASYMIGQLFSVCLCGVLHVLQVLYEVISAFCARYDWLIGGVLRGRYLVLFCCYVLCFLSKNLFTHSHCVGCGFRACFGVLFVDFTMLSLAVCCFVEQRTILPV